MILGAEKSDTKWPRGEGPETLKACRDEGGLGSSVRVVSRIASVLGCAVSVSLESSEQEFWGTAAQVLMQSWAFLTEFPEKG